MEMYLHVTSESGVLQFIIYTIAQMRTGLSVIVTFTKGVLIHFFHNNVTYTSCHKQKKVRHKKRRYYESCANQENQIPDYS